MLSSPELLRLQEFGAELWTGFGVPPVLVGSYLAGPGWRDVDVRVVLPDEEYAHWGLGDPDRPADCPRWRSLATAYSNFGRLVTRLPIDFQIQQWSAVEHLYRGLPSLVLGDGTTHLFCAPDARPGLCLSVTSATVVLTQEHVCQEDDYLIAVG